MEFELRPWKLSDLDNLVIHANNPNIAKNLTDGFPHPYTKEHALQFIANASKHEPTQVLAIVVDEIAVGGIGIHPQSDIHHKNAELGYWLSQSYWGKGIMTKAIEQMVKYGFENLPINRIFARPFGSNIPSQKVLEKAGFKLEARFEKTIFKNNAFEDELVYAMRKEYGM
ncbi:MAG: GNAT family protein [Bacteroidota bacterium]